MTVKKRYKHTTIRQFEGDDGYHWAVFVKGEDKPRHIGLTRPETGYYRDMIEMKEEAKKNGKTLEEKVKRVVPSIWAEISPDVDWPCDLDGAIELCVGWDRPVTFGYLTKEEFKELLKLPSEVVDRWAKEALKGYF